MEKDRSNILDEKVDVMKNCIKLIENAEEIIQCPVCFEIPDHMEQCVIGHLICVKCKEKIFTNTCPICKEKYSGTKSFIISELSKTFSNLKISLDKLENNEKPNKVEAYRNMIKKLLTKMSIFLNDTNGTFQMLSNYLQNPRCVSQNEMKKQLDSLTIQLHRLNYFMNDTKDTLVALKK